MWQHTKAHGILPYSLRIGQQLIARYPSQEKPHAPVLSRTAERLAKAGGVGGSQDAKSFEQPSIAPASRHGASNGHGTAHKGKRRRMGTPSLSIPPQLRLPRE